MGARLDPGSVAAHAVGDGLLLVGRVEKIEAPGGEDRIAGVNLSALLRWEWRLGSALYFVLVVVRYRASSPTVVEST